MNPTERTIVREGLLDNGNAFSLIGRAHNGTVVEVNKKITQIGQDVAIILPECNVVGVFDGAGGATDIGSPEEAALTAAYAVDRYFTGGGAMLSHALEFARDAVKANQEAGLCVAALVQFCHGTVRTVNAGDTAVVSYDTRQDTLEIIAEQQSESGQPTNYLGRHAARIALPIADSVARYQQPYRSDKELYVLSDGALGSWQRNNSLEDYHFHAAHHEYQLLRDARAYDANFEINIRTLLNTGSGSLLRAQQIEESGQVRSPELNDSSLFSASSFDWDIWDVIVRPYIEAIGVPRTVAVAREIGESLLSRPISWDFEKSPNDDATLVIIKSATGG